MDLKKTPKQVLIERGIKSDTYQQRKEHSRFMRFQDNVFSLLQEQGYYIKEIDVWDIDYKEREKVFHLALKMWDLMADFDKIQPVYNSDMRL